jgi:hypothetical protein
MRKMTVAALALSLASPASSAEILIKLDDGAQNAVVQLPALLDQCVSGVMLRGDATTCKGLSNFLVLLGNVTKNSQAAAAKSEAEAKAVADKAAEDAKKAAPKPDENER